VKRLLVTLLKVGVSVGILAWLFVEAQRNAVFYDLWERPKRWGLLGVACALEFLAVLVTLVRWHFLVRALGLPLPLRETLRIGFLGYLFNLAPMGIVGGDLLKAVMLAHRQPERRAESVATVFVDRALGLYVLFLVASGAMVVTGFWRVPDTAVQLVCKATLGVTVVATAAMAAALGPDLTRGKSTELVRKIPYFGPPLAKLVIAVRMYRHQLPTLALATAMSVAVHSLFAMAVYLISAGLYDAHHSLGTNLVVSPISAVTGVLPINLGPFEGVLNFLYTAVPLPDGSRMASGQGLVVALGYRIGTVLVAAIGLAYFLAARQEVAELMEEASHENAVPVGGAQAPEMGKTPD
jgi:uncharacterized membrane protein YbhN (UPF0104 family)